MTQYNLAPRCSSGSIGDTYYVSTPFDHTKYFPQAEMNRAARTPVDAFASPHRRGPPVGFTDLGTTSADPRQDHDRDESDDVANDGNAASARRSSFASKYVVWRACRS
jgi:hypothetical protein